jgi:hypothetical protein
VAPPPVEMPKPVAVEPAAAVPEPEAEPEPAPVALVASMPPELDVFEAPAAITYEDDKPEASDASLFASPVSIEEPVVEAMPAPMDADVDSTLDTEPESDVEASVPVITARPSVFDAVPPAPEMRMPAPESGPWAHPGRALASTPVSHSTDTTETAADAIDLPAASPEPVQAFDSPVARPKAGRPVWQSPWAAAAVLAIIAITTGVTFMGRRGPAATPTASANGGTLEIGTNPEGVAVFIDGTNRGVTPLTINLSAGAHVVELVTDTDRRKVPVTMKSGTHMSHFIEMPKTPAGIGDLQVRTDPSRATVSVDGKVVGRSPVTVKGLTAGTHRVVLEHESGTFNDDVVIEAGATASLVVPLSSKPAAAANVSGWIAISAPADLQVYEGGRLVGSSRSDRIMVAVGRHELEMVNESLGYRSTRTVDVGAGQVATVKPEWPKGSMALNALPWAEVSIDGEKVGETPIGSVTVPIGTHEIVFRHPDLGERRTTATVTTGAPTRVSMDMRAKGRL